jgi:hypothetical protein
MVQPYPALSTSRLAYRILEQRHCPLAAKVKKFKQTPSD